MAKTIDFLKKNNTKIIEYILVLFLIIQPVFDIKLFYNSISTLIRVVVIGILFLFYFLMEKNKKKYYLLIYLFVLIVYIFFHHLNALKFNSLVPGNFGYSLSKELLYFVKMLTPFLLIYILIKSNLDKNKIFMVIKTITLIIGLTIIISNFFMFSYSSYNDELIKANFFSWFNNKSNFTYQELSSKGLFEYANQISAILLMFLPICLISFIEKKSKLNILTIIVNIFALFLLSTKVAVFGVFIVFAYTILIYVIDKKILTKQHLAMDILSIFIVIIVLYGLILPINPSFMRIDETNTIAASTENIVEVNETVENPQSLQEADSQDLSKEDYIKQVYEGKGIKKEFIEERYPYTYDPDFWMQIIAEPKINRVNYRFIELAMVKRVVEINNNKLDILFGITNTRLQNIFNIEKDFVVQYYALGIIGVILIFAPYFAFIFFEIYKAIKYKLQTTTFTQYVSLITIIFIFGISYYSGNLLNSLGFTIYFALLFRLLSDKTPTED